jgi:hypothetical protein
MSIEDTEIDKDREELQGLRNMEMTLKLHNILMTVWVFRKFSCNFYLTLNATESLRYGGCGHYLWLS